MVVWGAACRGKGMDGLGQSPFAAAVLLSRVWIDNSMRHQNGRSRAAVASSLLLRLVSWSLLTLPLQDQTQEQSCRFMPSCSFSSPIRSVRSIMYVYPCLDLHPQGKIRPARIALPQRHGWDNSATGVECMDNHRSVYVDARHKE